MMNGLINSKAGDIYLTKLSSGIRPILILENEHGVITGVPLTSKNIHCEEKINNNEKRELYLIKNDKIKIFYENLIRHLDSIDSIKLEQIKKQYSNVPVKYMHQHIDRDLVFQKYFR